ncbi:hypothetical protein FOVG_17113 [Fusarium oxysporum f. sp. pisi HDV247]|uniref:Uncharacterized protein n=1 Tax=Fusarium oxysporum f. sp. pisi HDV247 TaxID=1080344 RepID=W9NUY3_FUSOX|nr:hypothetical protein FOVG_17113 [Fusarium oxysporum f. sp. pisi HDV247]
MFRCLPLLIFAFVGSAFAQGNSQCAQWCAANFRNPGEICTSLAAKGKGPCYDCGPLSTNPAEKLCGEVCKDTSSDNANCGGCGISIFHSALREPIARSGLAYAIIPISPSATAHAQTTLRIRLIVGNAVTP